VDLGEEQWAQHKHTLEDDQDQANVSQGKKGRLPVKAQDIGNGHAVDEADDDVPD
jgi:hypothetical protein